MKRKGQAMLRKRLEGLSDEEVQLFWDRTHEENMALRACLRAEEAAENGADGDGEQDGSH